MKIHLQRKNIFICIHRPCRLGHALMLFCTAKTSRVIRVHNVLQGFLSFRLSDTGFDAFFSNIHVIPNNPK